MLYRFSFISGCCPRLTDLQGTPTTEAKHLVKVGNAQKTLFTNAGQSPQLHFYTDCAQHKTATHAEKTRFTVSRRPRGGTAILEMLWCHPKGLRSSSMSLTEKQKQTDSSLQSTAQIETFYWDLNTSAKSFTNTLKDQNAWLKMKVQVNLPNSRPKDFLNCNQHLQPASKNIKIQQPKGRASPVYPSLHINTLRTVPKFVL